MENDTQGIPVGDFEDLLCDRCGNSPLTYYCPLCDFRVCSDCIHKAFRKQRSGALVCRRCGHEDNKLETFVNPDQWPKPKE